MNRIVEISNTDYRVIQRIGIPVLRVWTPEGPKPSQAMPKRRRHKPPSRGVPIAQYRPTLLRVMKDMGGRADAYVGSPLYQRLKPLLAKTAYDRALLPSGRQVRWWNSVCWTRQKFIKSGVFRNDSRHSVWELA